MIKVKEFAIYTALTGNYDKPALLEGIQQVLLSADVFIFCNEQLSVPEGVQVVSYKPTFADPVRQARYFKVAGHPLLSAYAYTIWVDANLKVLATSADSLWHHFAGNALMAVANHTERNCTYHEAEACLALGKDDPTAIYRQIFKYKTEGFPENAGLQETRMVFRRNHPYCQAVSALWWQQISQFSRRDQLSLNYVFWKLGDSHCRKFDIDWYNNEMVLLQPHQFANNTVALSVPPAMPAVQGLPIPLPPKFPYAGLIPAIWQILQSGSQRKWITFSVDFKDLGADGLHYVAATSGQLAKADCCLIDGADKLSCSFFQLADHCKNGWLVIANYAHPANADALRGFLQDTNTAHFQFNAFQGLLVIATHPDLLEPLTANQSALQDSWQLAGTLTEALYQSHARQITYWQWLQPFYNHPLWKLKQKLKQWLR